MPKTKKKISRKTKKKTVKSSTKKKKAIRTTTAKKPVKKTKKTKAQKPKKRITHKLTYAPRKAVVHIMRSNSQQTLGNRNGKTVEYTFRPDKKPDETPSKIKDIGKANLRTQLVHLQRNKLHNLPVIKTADTAADILNGISKNDREVAQVIYLNGRNKVIGIETAHKGSVNATITSPHEIMKTALLTNASAIIFAHNHPSGDPTPSVDDIRVTKKLKEAGKFLDIEVLDSIVIGKSKYYSLKQEGVI